MRGIYTRHAIWGCLLAAGLIVAHFQLCYGLVQIQPPNIHVTAFKLSATSITADQFRMLLGKIKSDIYSDVTINDVMIRYRIILFTGTPPPAVQARLEEAVHSIDQHAKLIKLPSREDKNRIEIPTGELVVQFKNGVDGSEATSILLRSHLKIVESPPENAPGRYITVDKDDDVNRLMHSVASLSKNQSVRFVEPDVLEPLGSPSANPY